MPKLAQVEARNQVRGVHVMECHGCQVIAEVPQVKDRLGQDKLEACAWDQTLAE